jgi:hypothetical protein
VSGAVGSKSIAGFTTACVVCCAILKLKTSSTLIYTAVQHCSANSLFYNMHKGTATYAVMSE